MKILHVYKNYYPIIGGIENYMRMVCADLAAQGHDVTALVANSAPRTTREVIEGVQVIRAGALGTVARTPLSPMLFREIARLRPDVTHLHFPYPVGELAQLLFGRSKRTVITYHSDVVKQRLLRRLLEPVIYRTLASADRILPTSANYVSTSPYLSRFPDRCTVVPAGIDHARFEQVDHEAVEVLRNRFGSPLVLFVGLLRYYKGIEYLIEAMRDVPARLVLVGGGPLDGQLRALVRREALENKVFFAGAVPDSQLPSYYHACDVFVLPASHRSEAFGLAQVEAMFCEKPVVCTELGTGTSYVNLSGITGLVVPARRSDALAEAINRLLDDSDMRRRFGRAAAERARAEFSREIAVRRVASLYDELIKD